MEEMKKMPETLIFEGLGRIAVGLGKMNNEQALTWVTSLINVLGGIQDSLLAIRKKEAEG